MDPRRVLTFRAVAHERSFSAAARSLALTQPAVSQQVAALEKEVGARLLDREPGGLNLTRAGQVLLEHADALADRLALAEHQLAELALHERTRLRIGGFPSALATLVPKSVARMAARGETREGEARGDEARGGGGAGAAAAGHGARGSSEVLVVEGDTVALAGRVRSGELHLAVGFQDAAQPRREHDGTERRDLAREPFLVALWPGHPLAERETIPLAALANEPWVAPSGEGVIARSCAAAGFEMRLVMISRDPLANRALIAQGLAVTLVPRMLGAEFQGVELRPLEGGGPQRDVYAILPLGGARHPLVEPTLAALAEVASELA
jgi:DNA-binding transcriptional LysR family regulator